MTSFCDHVKVSYVVDYMSMFTFSLQNVINEFSELTQYILNLTNITWWYKDIHFFYYNTFFLRNVMNEISGSTLVYLSAMVLNVLFLAT